MASTEAGASQSVRAQLRLREMILAGALPGGARVAELTLVEALGVSRTPIRAALMRLEQEGLLHRLPGGGYAVRTFSETDVADAIELRGTMEGLAARLAAERGVAPELLREAHDCLDAIDATLAPPTLDDEGFSRYVELNAQFHGLLSRMVGSEVVAMLHASALASVVTLQDILGAARTLNARHHLSLEGLLVAAALYMALTFALVGLFALIERRYLAHLRLSR